MALDVVAAFDQVKALISSIEGMQLVKEGVPESLGPSFSAFIAVSPIALDDSATGEVQAKIIFYIFLGYKVSDNESQAERRLIAGLQDLIPKFYTARKTGFNDTVENAEINLTLAAQPEYEILASQEYRRYPVLITVWQSLDV
jgi:hypothetical protein